MSDIDKAEKGYHYSCTMEVNSEKKEKLFKLAKNFGSFTETEFRPEIKFNWLLVREMRSSVIFH